MSFVIFLLLGLSCRYLDNNLKNFKICCIRKHVTSERGEFVWEPSVTALPLNFEIIASKI